MREESHLDEMRDAIRGDFERLAERRGEQELMRPPELGDAAGDAPADADDPVPPGLEPSEIGPEYDADSGPDVVERRSWLARLFST
jgi:hypothetical protein